MTASILATPAAEVRRLRAELDAAQHELAHLRDVAFAADPAAAPEYWRSLFGDGHRADIEAARRDERTRVETEYAAAWRSIAEPIVHPERGAERRLRLAEAGCRRDAAELERSFVARAHNTHDRDRTHVQRGTVQLYPRKTSAA